MTKTRRTPDYVTIYFDLSDPADKGWAYNVIIDGDHTSGPLTARRPDASLATLRRRLAAEFTGTAIAVPSASEFKRCNVGDGWEFAA